MPCSASMSNFWKSLSPTFYPTQPQVHVLSMKCDHTFNEHAVHVRLYHNPKFKYCTYGETNGWTDRRTIRWLDAIGGPFRAGHNKIIFLCVNVKKKSLGWTKIWTFCMNRHIDQYISKVRSLYEYQIEQVAVVQQAWNICPMIRQTFQYICMYTCQNFKFTTWLLEPEVLLRSIIPDDNILNKNFSIRQTTIYTFFDKFNTESCLNRYDKMRPLFFKIAHGPF